MIFIKSDGVPPLLLPECYGKGSLIELFHKLLLRLLLGNFGHSRNTKKIVPILQVLPVSEVRIFPSAKLKLGQLMKRGSVECKFNYKS